MLPFDVSHVGMGVPSCVLPDLYTPSLRSPQAFGSNEASALYITASVSTFWLAMGASFSDGALLPMAALVSASGTLPLRQSSQPRQDPSETILTTLVRRRPGLPQ